ncbi:uncharacterized protein LOC121390547 [Gigantopelta aegis]|uniref:uncharacterized protein LOC121390547 n=1 Tax=Gigantopelta aegis TaxID=1735272 RepID=UPI001B887F97|nr:uncharacterized protein LOC121390547 [Gigantopelta aegis]
MKSLVLLILAAVVASSSGFQGSWSDLVYPMWGCNPPKTLRGVVKLAMFNNIRNDDEVIDQKDFMIDLMEYDYDNDPCQVQKWEWVYHWRCVYGYSERYTRWFFDNRIDIRKVGYIDLTDTTANISFPTEEFKARQYDRLAVDYCNNTVNWEDPLCDRVKAETREMVLAE